MPLRRPYTKRTDLKNLDTVLEKAAVRGVNKDPSHHDWIPVPYTYIDLDQLQLGITYARGYAIITVYINTPSTVEIEEWDEQEWGEIVEFPPPVYDPENPPKWILVQEAAKRAWKAMFEDNYCWLTVQNIFL